MKNSQVKYAGQSSETHCLPCYRPQTKFCGKVIFSEACVKNSVHSGGGIGIQGALKQGVGIPACFAGGIPACLAGLQGVGVSRSTPKGEVEGSGRVVSRTIPGEGGVSQHALRQTPSPLDGYCHGRYASYWNAFLYIKFVFRLQDKTANPHTPTLQPRRLYHPSHPRSGLVGLTSRLEDNRIATEAVSSLTITVYLQQQNKPSE